MIRKAVFALVIALAFAFASQSALAQQTQNDELKLLRKEIDSLKEGQSRIEKTLQEIRTMLQARPGDRPVDIPLTVANQPFLGDANAKLTIIEFSDYQ